MTLTAQAIAAEYSIITSPFSKVKDLSPLLCEHLSLDEYDLSKEDIKKK